MAEESLILEKSKIIVPENYDYVGIYLTDVCHLKCRYCITSHYGADFLRNRGGVLSADEWVAAINRLVLPDDFPVTLQGGEPFLYGGIWEILERVKHKVDIMTALPPNLSRSDFLKLKTLEWNRRPSPYPTIRVSYHKGQHDFCELVDRISELNDILSIGLYYLEHPDYSENEIEGMKCYAKRKGVELRSKEYLGDYNGKKYGTYMYPDAVCGERIGRNVLCKNTVVPVAPDGTVYRCHSDLYFGRKELALGNILDDNFSFPGGYLPCANYGLCSECDVKIKTNRYQQYGYTSVDIRFTD